MPEMGTNNKYTFLINHSSTAVNKWMLGLLSALCPAPTPPGRKGHWGSIYLLCCDPQLPGAQGRVIALLSSRALLAGINAGAVSQRAAACSLQEGTQV